MGYKRTTVVPLTQGHTLDIADTHTKLYTGYCRYMWAVPMKTESSFDLLQPLVASNNWYIGTSNNSQLTHRALTIATEPSNNTARVVRMHARKTHLAPPHTKGLGANGTITNPRLFFPVSTRVAWRNRQTEEDVGRYSRLGLVQALKGVEQILRPPSCSCLAFCLAFSDWVHEFVRKRQSHRIVPIQGRGIQVACSRM